MTSNFRFFILWLISPLLSILVLCNKKIANIKIFPLLLVSIFFGLSFVIDPAGRADSVRYYKDLKTLNQSDDGYFTYISKNLYAEDSNVIDIYQPTVTWLVGRLTDDHRVLFAVFAFVFGYFWFKSFSLLRGNSIIKRGSTLYLLCILFLLLNPIWHINGVRMWTAVQIFFYGLVLLHLSKDKRGFLLMILSLSIHFSISAALFLYVIYRLIPPSSYKFLYWIFLVSWFYGSIDFGLSSIIADSLPDFLQSRRAYFSYQETSGLGALVTTRTAIHIRLYDFLLRAMMLILASVMALSSKRVAQSNPDIFKLFYYGIFIGLITNFIGDSVASFGRFTILSNLLICGTAILLMLRSPSYWRLHSFNIPIKVVLTFLLVVGGRGLADYVGISFLLGNPILALITSDSVPLIYIIKGDG